VIEGHIWLYVRVVQHPANEKGIHLDNEITDADEVEAQGTQCAKETIQF
jgi:hypothetical protein